ncbi:MAG: hypothetical protein OEU94_01650 [Aquincola sp.]|nr:hypothetical protein [Aquincola sp.]MDH4287305.1 hypothetical protein [Aquincola sp.]MDH5329362.1 hypothetical protein [Aquincola sp.]
MTGLPIAAAVSAAAVSIACTPALDWREVRPEGSHLQLMFPCKPASHTRRVSLADTTVEMSMFACTADEATYALVFADVQDPLRVTPALDELSRSLAANVQAAGRAASSPLVVAGMTPNDSAASWVVAGQLPDGRAVQERAALFAYGTRIYQATVVGSRSIGAEASAAFFSGLRVSP